MEKTPFGFIECPECKGPIAHYITETSIKVVCMGYCEERDIMICDRKIYDKKIIEELLDTYAT